MKNNIGSLKQKKIMKLIENSLCFHNKLSDRYFESLIINIIIIICYCTCQYDDLIKFYKITECNIALYTCYRKA